MKDQSQTTETQPAAPENKLEVGEAGKMRLNELGEKPIGRLLLQYALPAITAMAASSLYNIIDGIFIGQGVGPEAIMGLALTGPLMALGAAFGAMVGVGGATLMSVRLGQKDYRMAQDILGNVLFMNVVMGLGLGILLQVFLTPILRFFGASDVTIGPAHDFMTVRGVKRNVRKQKIMERGCLLCISKSYEIISCRTRTKRNVTTPYICVTFKARLNGV